jgi:deoxyribodipyrimidine photo-lyase
MIVASLLTKNLGIHWLEGAQWFWDTLVDADCANNTLGWQWSAGCGADAAPYFRIFNPVRQSERFDPQGEYIKHWLPELTPLPSKYLHAPWQAPSSELNKAGIVLGKTYPEPIVNLQESRKEALLRWDMIRQQSIQDSAQA